MLVRLFYVFLVVSLLYKVVFAPNSDRSQHDSNYQENQDANNSECETELNDYQILGELNLKILKCHL